jgi:hypothetical protein
VSSMRWKSQRSCCPRGARLHAANGYRLTLCGFCAKGTGNPGRGPGGNTPPGMLEFSDWAARLDFGRILEFFPCEKDKFASPVGFDRRSECNRGQTLQTEIA